MLLASTLPLMSLLAATTGGWHGFTAVLKPAKALSKMNYLKSTKHQGYHLYKTLQSLDLDKNKTNIKL